MKDSRLGKFWEGQFDRLINALGQGGQVATSSDKVNVSVDNVTADSADFSGDIYCDANIDCNPDIQIDCNPEVSVNPEINMDMDDIEVKLGYIDSSIEEGFKSIERAIGGPLNSIAEEIASLRMIVEGLVDDSYHKEPEVTDQVTNGLDDVKETLVVRADADLREASNGGKGE